MEELKVACQNCKLEFEIFPEDLEFYKRMEVPAPTWCPECRLKRRMCFRNERKSFRVEDGLSGGKILSLYPPESGYVMYKDIDWHGDKWDPMDHGQEIDFSRPFLTQLQELNLKVPKPTTDSIGMIDSDYSANGAYLKNCYLVFNSQYDEDCAYGNAVDHSTNCFDNSHILKSDSCYGSFWITSCFRTHFSSQCEDCQDVWFSRDCRGCSNSIGCVNLRMKSYCIFNEQYSKEEYEKIVREMRLDTATGIEKLKKKAFEFWKSQPVKFLEGVQNLNVSGEYVTNSKNVKNGYLVRESQNSKNLSYAPEPSTRDSMDCTVAGANSDLLYETSVCGWGGANIKFSLECWSEVKSIEYSMFCQSSSDLFGCVGLRNKRYCILNKQYSKEEYESLVPKIKKLMDEMPYVDAGGRIYKYGEFFPPEFSPFAYQNTILPEHFSWDKEDALKMGLRWQEANPTEYQTTIKASDIPDAISEVTDKITEEIISCAECKKAYRIIPQELQFIRNAKLPAPRRCVDCRHAERISKRNKMGLYLRSCACKGDGAGGYKNLEAHFHRSDPCLNNFQTSYAPDRSEIVYCEECYQGEVA